MIRDYEHLRWDIDEDVNEIAKLNKKKEEIIQKGGDFSELPSIKAAKEYFARRIYKYLRM